MHNQLEVSLSAIQHNVKILREQMSDLRSSFYPVLKSDAYGLGAEPVISILLKERLYTICMCSVEEALSFQSLASKGLRILILNPFLPDELYLLEKNSHWIPVVSSFRELDALLNLSLHRTISIHIKINIGLSRFGFALSDIKPLMNRLIQQNQVQVEGVYSHLAKGDTASVSDGDTDRQIQIFNQAFTEVQSYFPLAKAHLLNSLGLLSYISHQKKIKWGARVGGSLYGIKKEIYCENQEAYQRWKNLPLQSVSTLKSRILSCRLLKKGEAVSYGGLWVARKKTNIAIVSMGYYHGLFHVVTDATMMVLFRGVKVPVVGEVCMNHFMIDITDVMGFNFATIGEEVVIYGKQKSNLIQIEELAKGIRRDPYEVMTSTSSKVHRVYVE